MEEKKHLFQRLWEKTKTYKTAIKCDELINELERRVSDEELINYRRILNLKVAGGTLFTNLSFIGGYCTTFLIEAISNFEEVMSKLSSFEGTERMMPALVETLKLFLKYQPEMLLVGSGAGFIASKVGNYCLSRYKNDLQKIVNQY
jgi:hypothetical protein